jgi:hypothetical protein
MIRTDITNDQYHNSSEFADFVSSSQLKNILISPAHFQKMKNEQKETTVPMIFGSAYHDYIEERIINGFISDFESNWHIFEHPRNKKTGETVKTTTKGFTDAMPEGNSISDVQYQQIKTMSRVFFRSPHVIKFLRNITDAVCEESIFTEYKGIKVKTRKDLLFRRSKSHSYRIIDFKTCGYGESSILEVHKPIINYGYDFSAGMYQIIEHSEKGEYYPFFWIFQEKEEPYTVNIHSAQNYALHVYKTYRGTDVIAHKAVTDFEKAIDVLRHCIDSGIYPDSTVFIDNKAKIGAPEPPYWYTNKHTDFYLT